jgi:outer membrane protein OmpA-like peptidoglycan-associated protein
VEGEQGGSRIPSLLTIMGFIAVSVVLIWAASWWTAQRIEHDLGQRARTALGAAGIDATVRFAGRDATMVGTVAGARDQSTALTIVDGLWGVRRVTSDVQVKPVAPQTTPSAPSQAPSATPSEPAVWPQGSISFDTGSEVLTPAAQTYLDSVIPYLQKHGSVNVVIRGYSDSVGNQVVNRALSQHRADVVAAYLAVHGVSTGRLQTQSFGASRPVTSDDTPLGRSVNRRVELVFVEAH